MTPAEMQDWNKKVYGPNPEHLEADWFWSRFRIQSAPKFPLQCWYHIPKTWENEVADLIGRIQKTFGNKVEFRQVKEKFCGLVVYWVTSDDVGMIECDGIQVVVDKWIAEAQNVLRKRGVHI